MRFVSINRVRPGMKLASNLYDSKGRTIIGENCMLTVNYIDRLKQFGYGGVYISDEFSDDIVIENVISPSLREAGIESLKKADIDKCSSVAKSIVSEILPKEKVCLDMADLRSFDDYTFAHSVNVAVLCCVIGMGMGFNESDLEQLTLAALLHDIGKLEIPEEIVNKTSRLTPEEFGIMKTHPTRSYEMLTDRYDISAKVRQAVLFHHENVDGSGYPNGLVGDEIPLMVKILHVADVYDALTSNRPYKQGYAPFDAVEYIMGACGIMFDKAVVEQFLQLVPLYPKGIEVDLSDGSRGFVIENSGVNNLRPIVRILDTYKRVDLSSRENYNITIVTSGDYNEEAHIQSEQARKKMLTSIKKFKIMAVDDMATNLQLLKEILEDKYDLILMKTGMQAVSYIEKIGTPDLILMDVDMPQFNGVEAAKKINELTQGRVPILFVSAICDRQTVLMCKELNAAGYVARPYKPIYIKAEIERILEGVEAI